MNTWWITRLPSHKGGRIIMTAYRYKCSIGPYWTAAEALKMIKKWR